MRRLERFASWLMVILPPALLGAMTLFAFAPFALWPLALVSLTLFFGLVDTASDSRRAALVGWGYGIGYFAAATHWIYISLHDFGGLPAVVSVLVLTLLAAFLALYPALAAWGARRLAGRQRAALLLLALPCCWLLTEWLRGWLLTGFPWSSIGYTQIPDGPLAGFAPVVGIYGVGGLLAWLAGALAWLVGRRVDRGSALAMLAGTVIVSGGLLLRPISWTAPKGNPLRVALLQGGIPQNQKWGNDDLVFNLRTYAALLKEAQGDLLLMPETALPIFLHEAPGYFTDPELGRQAEARYPVLPDDYLEHLIGMARAKGAALISGAPRFTRDGRHYLNGAVLLTGAGWPSYYKSHLVPFGEYVPLRGLIGGLYAYFDMPLDDFSAGAPVQPPLRVRDQRIATNICYEDIFGEELLANAANATILFNLSNLAWFDGSVALAQHGQIAQARSLETGRPSLLVTKTGTTAVVDPRGHYQAKLPERVQAVLSASVQGYDGTTPYMRLGNWPAVLLGALGAVFAFISGRRVARARA
ncbi:apolipoprotein N-acyltransferase [Chitinimonas sp.]|uniref:apolipoprotein N-acyltransferase n=1 Tax=Chitinimonas sp. TaxID=1934313 RepID=UPI0035B28F21